MRKYYIFAAIFMVFCYGLATYSSLEQRQKAKDEKTLASLQEALQNVEQYYTENGVLPIDEQPIKDFPKDKLEYVKVREKSFMICADINRSAGGYDVSSYVSTEQYQKLQDEVNALKNIEVEFLGKKQKANYIAVSSGFQVSQVPRQEGINCFVYRTDVGSFLEFLPDDELQTQSYNLVDDACDTVTNSSDYISATLTEIDVQSKQINLSTDGQFVIKADGSVDEGGKKYKTLKFDDKTVFCGPNQDVIKIEDINENKLASVYTADYIKASRVDIAE